MALQNFQTLTCLPWLVFDSIEDSFLAFHWRTKCRHTGINNYIPNTAYGVPLDEVTMAQLLKGAGYACHAVGKVAEQACCSISFLLCCNTCSPDTHTHTHTHTHSGISGFICGISRRLFGVSTASTDSISEAKTSLHTLTSKSLHLTFIARYVWGRGGTLHRITSGLSRLVSVDSITTL